MRCAASLLLSLLALLLGAPGASAKGSPVPPPRAVPLTVPTSTAVTAEAIWGDGQGRLFVVRGDTLSEYRRGQPHRDHRLPSRGSRKNLTRAITGTGQGAALVLVVWDNAGRAVRLRGDVWESALLPAELPYKPCLGAVDSAGTFACATDAGTLWLWSAEETPALRSYAPQQGPTYIRAITAGPPGTFYLTEQHRQVLEFREGRYYAHTFNRLDHLPQGPLGAWYSSESGVLWVTGPYEFIALDLKTGAVRQVRSPEALKPEDLNRDYPWLDLRGVHSHGRDVLWVSNSHEKGVYLFDGRLVYFAALERDRRDALESGEDHLHGSALLLPDATLYTALDHGVSSRRVAMRALGSGRGDPVKPASPDIVPIPFATVGLGPRWGLDSADRSHSLALDLTFGTNMMFAHGEMFENAGLWVAPQLGYSYGQSANLFMTGIGIGYGSALAGVMYTPRVITGTPQGERVVGFRHGLSGHLFLGVLSIEVAHQVMPRGGHTEQDLRLMVNLNPLLPAVGGIAAATAPVLLPLLLGALFH